MTSLEPSRFRICTPGETFTKVSPYFSRLGITRIAAQTGLDRVGIPVWCAYTPNAKAIVIAQGKGMDDDSARTSATMEAVERVIATQPDCELHSSSYAALTAAGHAVHKMTILLSARGLPIADEESISWTRAKRLVDQSDIWVPYDAVCFDRTKLNPRFWLSTDGLASGNTLNEAVLHGLLERVERDALALWAIDVPRRRFQNRIKLASLADDTIQTMLARIDEAGLEIALFNITSDLGVPCISALMRPKEATNSKPRHVDVTLGAGCSPFPMVAAARAISEAVQSRMTFIAGARDDLMPETFSRPVDPSLLRAFMGPEAVAIEDLSELPGETTELALNALLNRLNAHGISELFAVDLTPDWLPVSVAKILAPQLESPDGDRRQRVGQRALLRRLQ
jgi:ribosomal protein S12 methylthiotransferase accessory factor